MNPGRFHHSRLPKNRIVRITMGVLFIIGGVFGFLPVVGYWMIFVGLLILSVDFAIARRWRRKLEVWWGKRQREKNKAKNDRKSS